MIQLAEGFVDKTYSGYVLKWNGVLRESTWKGIAEQITDQGLESDDEDAENFEEVVSTGPADSTELTGHVDALEMTEAAEEVDIPVVEYPNENILCCQHGLGCTKGAV